MMPSFAALTGIMNSPALIALGWALFHFVWQGALAALAAWLALAALRRASARARYALTCSCLLAMIMCVPVTWWLEYSPTGTAMTPVSRAPAIRMPVVVNNSTSGGGPAPSAAAPMLQWLVMAWCVGVAVRGTCMAGGWWLARRNALDATGLAPAELIRSATNLARKLGVTGRFRLVTAARGSVPFVFGWLKPVLVMPLAAMAGLSSWQLEAVLAHELAHIARCDALVNALQTIAECLLFYHPGVWWISRRIRQEREHCCDELAVRLCGDRVEYSRALLALEEARARWVMAAGGVPLRERIGRLLGRNDVSGGSVMLPTTMLVVLSAVLGAGLLSGGQAEKTIDPQSPAESPAAGNATEESGDRAGVAGGVPGGVRGGVPGGVAGGVHGGVVGGVAGGVRGGIAGGISSVVPGGVAGGVPGAVPAGVPMGVGGGLGRGDGAGYGSGRGTGIRYGVGVGVEAQAAPGGSTSPTEERLRSYEQAIKSLQHAAERLMRDKVTLGEQLRRLNVELEKSRLEQLTDAQLENMKHLLVSAQLNQILVAAQRFSTDELDGVQKALEMLKSLSDAREVELLQKREQARAREIELKRRIEYAEERFKDEGGRNSDRGAVYIQYGAPDEIESDPDQAWEVWRYNELAGVNGKAEFRFEGRPLKKFSGPAPAQKL